MHPQINKYIDEDGHVWFKFKQYDNEYFSISFTNVIPKSNIYSRGTIRFVVMEQDYSKLGKALKITGKILLTPPAYVFDVIFSPIYVVGYFAGWWGNS